jgi:hypothetical protein
MRLYEGTGERLQRDDKRCTGRRLTQAANGARLG